MKTEVPNYRFVDGISMLACRSMVVILILIATASCFGRKSAPAPLLRIGPAPGVYVQYDSRTSAFRIGNELVERRIAMNSEKRFIFTTVFTNKLSGRNYIRSLSKEFSFRVNGTELSGVTGDFEYVSHEVYGVGGVRGVEISLRAMREDVGLLDLKLIYETYARMPVIRKWMEVENSGGSSIVIDSIQVEWLSLMPGSEYDLEVYATSSDGAEMLSPVVLDTRLMEGFLVGNEAPGVLKYSHLYSDGGFVSIGMQPHSQNYATETHLMPGERFTSPPAFILFFKGEPDAAQEILEEFAAENISWSKTQHYSVWYENIPVEMTESETRQKAQLAAQSGADVFCLTGNWMDKRGDWNINENAHLEGISQYVNDLGMKLGLSIELAAADGDSQILTEYPQWVVENSSDDTAGAKMMCLGSEYTLYVVHRIDALVKELGIDYIKLTGPMIPNGEKAGCVASGHVHRSSGESLWYIYDGLFAICRRLHSQHSDLIVDISTESYAFRDTIDYALLKYADVKWPF